MICFVASCSASARNQEIASTLAAVNAAGSAFASYDASKQQAIVTSATSKALGESALSSWRQTQATVLLVFVSAYRTIALAATANDAQSLQAMVNAATIVTQELQSLGVKL
jgi:hypothetical protein